MITIRATGVCDPPLAVTVPNPPVPLIGDQHVNLWANASLFDRYNL